MKKTAFALGLFGIFALPAMAFADHYTFDPAHTSVVWRANHLGFSNPSGNFPGIEGTLDLDEQHPENSKVEVTVKTDALVTGSEKFDHHLKSLDFFNVEKYPVASFKSTRVELTGKDTAKVTGQLTLIGTTMPLTLNVKLNKIGDHPMTKKKTAGFSATAVIKRSDFGMTFGIPNVSNEVELAIEAEASVDSAPPAAAK